MKLATIILLLAAVAFLIFGVLPRGPQGDSPSLPQDGQAVLAKAKSDDQAERLSALQAVHRDPKLLDDTEVFAFVLSRLSIPDETERGAAELVVQNNRELVNSRLKPFLESTDFQKYIRGTAAIRIIGEPAGIYAELVGKRLRNSLLTTQNTADSQQEFKIRLASLWALEAMGQAAVPWLSDVTKVLLTKFEPGPEFNLRVAALRVLGAIGPAQKEVVPALIEFYKTGNPNLSELSQFLLTLGAIGPAEGLNTLDILMENCEAENFKARVSAIDSLGRLGQAASGARDKLVALMNDPRKGVEAHSAVAYYLITSETELPLQVLKKALDNPSNENESIELVGKLGPAAEPLVPVLKRKLDAPEAITREYAIVALKRIGYGSRDALSRLEKLASSDEDFLVREHARAAIEAIKLGAK